MIFVSDRRSRWNELRLAVQALSGLVRAGAISDAPYCLIRDEGVGACLRGRAAGGGAEDARGRKSGGFGSAAFERGRSWEIAGREDKAKSAR